MKSVIFSNLVCAVIFNFVFIFTTAAQTQVNITGPARSENFGRHIATLPNGNIVIADPLYDAPGPVQNVGAVYLYDGATLALISTLTGSTADDNVGDFDITVLSNGNFAVISPLWDNGASTDAGAVTICSGTSGCTGTVKTTNSLVGTKAFDQIGNGGIYELTNGKYVVNSPNWNDIESNVGAVTFCDTAAVCVGAVSVTNSLYGTEDSDNVGSIGIDVLPSGNYIVKSFTWSVFELGAVTFCTGTGSCSGTAVSASNSLVGSTFGDFVGSNGVTVLTNGNYVVSSANWQNSMSNSYVGAVTFCSGATGCAGPVTTANSLIGSVPNEKIGDGGTTALTNGNYVVRSFLWGGGRGAATWCSGTSGCSGSITAANSLVGSTANDNVSSSGVFALPGGKYVVGSPLWNAQFADVGAATFCADLNGCAGTISAANSLLGSSANDRVGNFIMVLTNGSYVVGTPNWDNGGNADVGASTFCNGTSGCAGTISAANSLIGTTPNDMVGSGGAALSNGNYVVRSPNWDGAFSNVGAATFCTGTGGCVGTIVTAANSLIGSRANDNVSIGGIFSLPNGNYVVRSGNWDNGAIVNAGAITYGKGASGTFGEITSGNSVLGTIANGGASQRFSFDSVNNQLIVSRPAENIVTVFKLLAPTAAPVIISGRVSNGKRGVHRARVTLTAPGGEVRSVVTNPFGYYRFEEVRAGETYIINVHSKYYSFNAQVVTVTEDLTNLNFTAQPATVLSRF